jgi:hypothetical protein
VHPDLHHPNQVCIVADVPTLVERLFVGLPECVKLRITERRFRIGWDACLVDIERPGRARGVSFCHIPIEVS